MENYPKEVAITASATKGDVPHAQHDGTLPTVYNGVYTTPPLITFGAPKIVSPGVVYSRGVIQRPPVMNWVVVLF